nr:PDZ domain-containing protein [bacterium]
KLTKSLVLAERPEQDLLTMMMTDSEKLLGVNVTALKPETAKEKGYSEKLEGIIVTRVIPGSSAERVDIQVDDVITEINDNPVTTKEQFEKALTDIVKEMKEKKDTERVILLHVYRADRRYPDKWVAPTISLEPEESQPQSPGQ